MDISIRQETKDDYRIVENLIREAFWNVYKPGCDEHLIVHKIRKTNAFIKELDYVACDGYKIVGNIVYSKAKIIDENNKIFEILCMGPLGVLPSYQRKGIGTLLMKHSIESARALGFNGIVIFGNPKFYNRFGFENAKKYNIKTSWGANFDAFMALELYPKSLSDMSGNFFEDPAFETNKEELEIFEGEFPHKKNMLLILS